MYYMHLQRAGIPWHDESWNIRNVSKKWIRSRILDSNHTTPGLGILNAWFRWGLSWQCRDSAWYKAQMPENQRTKGCLFEARMDMNHQTWWFFIPFWMIKLLWKSLICSSSSTLQLNDTQLAFSSRNESPAGSLVRWSVWEASNGSRPWKMQGPKMTFLHGAMNNPCWVMMTSQKFAWSELEQVFQK